MYSNKKVGRIAGVLFLLIFIIGVIVYQVLQGPVLFSDDYLSATAANRQKIVLSILLLLFNGTLSVIIATMLFPIFKKYSTTLALLYVAFSILSFVAVAIDNSSVIALLELSRAYVANNTDSLMSLGTVYYEKHWWTHYLSLLTSCLPLFILYYTLYRTKLIPKIISGVGIIAVLLMFIELLLSILGHGISMNMMIPIGLIELIFPIWLLFKGLNASIEKI
tara:strand:+ start:75313 stop:75975 length:663 start_codon:yes stop_codon:yes gene_type:complete